MNQTSRYVLFGIGLLIVAAGAGILAYLSPNMPDGTVVATPVASREDVLESRLDVLHRELASQRLDFDTLTTSSGRASVDRARVVPLLKEAMQLGDELVRREPAAHDAADKPRFFLLLLGDVETTAAIRATGSGNTPEAAFARALLALSDYVTHETDANTQTRAIDDYFVALKSTPNASDPKLIDGAYTFGMLPAASPAVRDHVIAAITETVPEPTRTALLARVKPLETSAAASQN